jgi:hypothetical protein
MSFSPTSPVTGLAQTGLTSPTYTIVADIAPDVNGKQVAVSALGGTQTGVTTHTAASPFTGCYWRPKVPKALPPLGNNGQYPSIPTNTHKVVGRKGVTPGVGQPATLMTVRVEMDIPAGAETYDAANVRACLSFVFGLLSQQSSGIGDTVVTNIL